MASDFERIKEEVRRRTDIVELVSQRVSLKKTGRNFTGLCPFHDDRKPSFSVSPEIGFYKCWSCGASGDAFKWVMETQRVDFMEALKILAKAAQVEVPEFSQSAKGESEQMELAMAEALSFFRENLREDRHALGYLDSRSLAPEIVDTWELGFGPGHGDALAMRLRKKGFTLAECQKLFLVENDGRGGYFDRFRNRLIFPIRDERGRLVAFGGRIVGQGQPKYINSSDTPLYSKSRVLYGMNRAKESIAKVGQAVLVEGYLDVIACHRAGVTQAVASLGTALAEDHVRLLRRWCSKVVVLYDADEAGQKAAERAAVLLSQGGLAVSIALLPPGDDPDTLLKTKGSQGVIQAVEQGVSPMEFRMSRLNARMGPEDSSYWDEVVTVLATAENPLELQRYLIPIAAKYPGISDRQAAAKALERMVVAARKNAKKASSQRAVIEEDSVTEVETTQPVVRLLPRLAGPERIVFTSLFHPAMIEMAWKFAIHAPLMKSKAGKQIATALTELGSNPPLDSSWVNGVVDESARNALIEIGMGELEPVELRVLEDAVDRLARELEERQMLIDAQSAVQIDDDDALRDISRRLGKLKGGEKQ